MKKAQQFNVGDKVFAKVKGYPAWPAIVIEYRNTKYNVKFYGTGETGIVKPKDLFYYLKNKNVFVKSLKRKDYNEAIEEIEAAIKECGTDGNDEENATFDSPMSSNTSVNDNVDSSKNNKRKRSGSVSLEQATGAQKRKRSYTPIPTVNITVPSAGRTPVTNTNATRSTSNSESEDDDMLIPQQNNKTRSEIQRSSSSYAITDYPEKLVEEESLLSNENTESEGVRDQEIKEESEKFTNTADIKTEEVDILTLADVKIVPEDYLHSIVTYADHVRKNEKKYKNKPPESRSKPKNEIVVAKLPEGKYVGIKYNRDVPLSIENEFERAEYDETEAKTILSLKNVIEQGSYKPEEDPQLFITNLDISEPEIQDSVQSQLIERKRTKLKFLRTESKLIELDVKIKGCLGLDKAEPKIAIEYLEIMLELDITALMLKKHPHVVDMVKRLRRYIGNVKEWNLSEDDREQFEVDAEKVRETAEKVYTNFSNLFNIAEETLFWDAYSDEVTKFKAEVKDMQENEVFALSSEPNTRQAFLDRLDEEEEMKIIIAKMEKNTKTVKAEKGPKKVTNTNLNQDNDVIENSQSDS